MGQPGSVAAVEEERPVSLVWAGRLLWTLVVFAGLVVVAMVVRHDDLLRAWAEGNASARRILETEGLEALKNAPEGKIVQPHFIAPAITLYVTVALVVWVLSVFLRNGFEWGRICLTALLVVVAICSVGGILTGPPLGFVIGTVVAIALGVGTIVLMWLPASTRYIHPRADRPGDLREEVGL